METNQPSQNIIPPTPSTQPINIPPAAQIPPLKTKKPWLLISFIVLLLGTTGTFAYKYYQLKQQLDNQQPAPTPSLQLTVNNPSPIISPTSEIDPTASWETYTNTEYEYSIKHPRELKVGENGMSSGNTEIATAVVLYKEDDSNNSESPRFAITLRLDQNNLENISNNHYKKLTTNKLSEDDKKAAQKNLGYSIVDNKAIKQITKTSFNNLPAYQFTILGSTVDDGASEYGVPSESHHYIWVEKNNHFYLISFTNTETMNQILSTFKFTNQ